MATQWQDPFFELDAYIVRVAEQVFGTDIVLRPRHRVSKLACDQDVRLNPLRPKSTTKKKLFRNDPTLK